MWGGVAAGLRCAAHLLRELMQIEYGVLSCPFCTVEELLQIRHYFMQLVPFYDF